MVANAAGLVQAVAESARDGHGLLAGDARALEMAARAT